MLFERMLQAKKNLGLEEKLLANMFEQANEEVVIGQDYIDECAYLDEKNLVEDILELGKVPEPESPNDLDADKDVENTYNFSEEPVEKEFNSTLSVEELPSFSKPSVSTDEIIKFYASTPELIGRLYENGALEPSLTVADYNLDKIWADFLKGNVKLTDDLIAFYKAHDRHFQKLYETKKNAWKAEDKEFMDKIADSIVNTFEPHSLCQSTTKEAVRKALNNLEKPTTEEKEESMDKVQEFENSRLNPWEDTSGNTKSFVMDFLQNYADGDDIIQELRKDVMKIMSDLYWIREGKHENDPFAIDFADALNELSISI